LHDLHVAAGARMVDFAGWHMPVQYGSIIEEHMCVRTAMGLFDVSHMGEVEISGPHAEACCARLFANDATRLAPEKAQYSLICNGNGGVVDDVIVYRLASERFLVCLNASNVSKDVDWIREHAPRGCTIRDRSDDYALLAVQGPAAVGLVDRLVEGAAALPRFGVREAHLADTAVLLARTGYTGEDGFELFTPAKAAARLWRLLLDQGAPRGLRPIGLGARDTLRLEAALPLYGHELDEDVDPYEAGLAWVVKLNRPDMIGHDALRALAQAPRRRLVGLEVEGGIARQGCPVLASGTHIGMVTSGSYCPFVDKAVALALVPRDFESADLAVDVRGKPRRARVTDTPFYVRQRTRRKNDLHDLKVS